MTPVRTKENATSFDSEKTYEKPIRRSLTVVRNLNSRQGWQKNH